MANWMQHTKEKLLPSGDETIKDRVPGAGMPQRLESPARDAKESIIGADLTIEGKIEGDGDIRIEGKFKGDVLVKGSVTIESGAHISGEISANNVIISGHVEGNITASTQVTLLESCELIGDLKASSLTVAAGSRMRGMVEFGWKQEEDKKVEFKKAVNETDGVSSL